MIRKFILALIFTLPSLAIAIDLEGFYITPKGGVSKSMDTGTISFTNSTDELIVMQDEDLGTGTVFGLSVGKYVNDNFRLELEALLRTDYEYDAFGAEPIPARSVSQKADIDSRSIFINGFYDFQLFTLGNTSITPYLGGGIGVSKNKMGNIVQFQGAPDGFVAVGNTINQFAYKLAAGIFFGLTDKLSLDINYQYVDLGAFKNSTEAFVNGARDIFNDNKTPNTGGEIKTHELMIGLQYKF